VDAIRWRRVALALSRTLQEETPMVAGHDVEVREMVDWVLKIGQRSYIPKVSGSPERGIPQAAYGG
jgi:hypothetical protein